MPTWLVVVLVVVVVVLLLAALAGRGARRTLAGPDPTDVSIPADVAAEVSRLAVSGQQIAAIKLLRERTGLGLAASKQITDRMIARHQRGDGGSPASPIG